MVIATHHKLDNTYYTTKFLFRCCIKSGVNLINKRILIHTSKIFCKQYHVPPFLRDVRPVHPPKVRYEWIAPGGAQVRGPFVYTTGGWKIHFWRTYWCHPGGLRMRRLFSSYVQLMIPLFKSHPSKFSRRDDFNTFTGTTRGRKYATFGWYAETAANIPDACKLCREDDPRGLPWFGHRNVEWCVLSTGNLA